MAQIVPPPIPSAIKEWKGPNGGDWATAGSWTGLGPPLGSDNVLFGHEPVGGVVPSPTDDSIRQTVNTGATNIVVRSLWFKAGLWYTLSGTATIELNSGTSDGHVLVVTNDATAPKQSETNIENDIRLSGSFGGQNNRARIENWSEGGLRIGGLFKASDHNVQFGGTGAIHIANRIVNQDGNRGNPNFYIQGSTGTAENVHLILSGNNDQTFGGILNVNARGFLIVKTDQALGEGSNKVVHEGGTLGLRSHRETPLDYKQPQQNNFISLYGDGIVRSADTRRIGALYNDGGWNSLDMRIDQTTPSTAPTGFGSRGDRAGGLELKNQVKLTTQFIKLGPGLIVLNNTRGGGQANQWDKDTVLRAGVLRFSSAAGSPTASNFVFDGGVFGGILELGYGTSTFNYNLGTGGGNIRWADTGDGGFSAFGGARTVSINGGATLTWGSTTHFVGDGQALLLSSRYANNVITFTNAINLNGALREVRVERGEDSAHGVLSGGLSGAGGGLVKTGDGLLQLTGSNPYSGATRIVGGALRGAAANTATNIQLAGGVLGLDANLTLRLGTSGNQIRWLGSGGFAAYGANRNVTFVGNGGSAVSLTWGTTGGFIGSDQELRFGHHTANGTVLWNNALALGSGERTIRIEGGQQISGTVVNFLLAISGTATLNLIGNGRIDLSANNSALSSSINIYGAELRLLGSGKLGAAAAFDIRHGGALVIRNTNAASDTNRIGDTAAITLAAGTVRLEGAATPISERIGELSLESGASTIELIRNTFNPSVELHIEALTRDSDSRATLNVSGDLSNTLLSLKVEQDASGHLVGGIIPWATNGNEWIKVVGNALKALDGSDYHTGGQTTWNAAHNVKETGGTSLSGNRTINSLIFGNSLNLSGRSLTLNSGGLMNSGLSQILGGLGSTITTSGGTRPLYIHNNGQLSLTGSVALTGGMDVVKTRGGDLIFNNNTSVTHHIGSLYIHQGTVELGGRGTLQVRRITIGDGAGNDRLILPGNRWNPITSSNGLPSITLRGTRYDPRGPEYGGDQGAGTKQHLAELRIEGRGTIDWRGGEVGQANILWIDTLSFSSTSDILFIRNWYEYEDLFLVKRVHNGVQFDDLKLNQIVFEGYQDYFTTLKDYDADYWQITPWGAKPAPEPSTYGAILGAVGLALVAWRRKRRRKPTPQD